MGNLKCVLTMGAAQYSDAIEEVAEICELRYEKIYRHKQDQSYVTKVQPAPKALNDYLTQVIVEVTTMEEKEWFEWNLNKRMDIVEKLERDHALSGGLKYSPLKWHMRL